MNLLNLDDSFKPNSLNRAETVLYLRFLTILTLTYF